MHPHFYLKRELLNRVEFGKLRAPSSMEPHFHSSLELYLVLSGQAEVLVNDRKKTVRAGEIAAALSYDAHGFRIPAGTEMWYLIVPISFMEEFVPLFAERRLASPFFDDPAVFETVRGAIRKLAAGANDVTRKGLVYQILGALYDASVPKTESGAVPHGFSAEILIYINGHFKDELRLTDLARVFGYNPAYLSRSFRQTFGVSFVRYLTMLRLREAVLLLRAGKTVTESAEDSGFGSMRSFYRAFYEEYACSPRAYLARPL